jgi:hypothetical protein
MTIVLTSTNKIVQLSHAVEHSPIEARIWEGKTESGTKIYCFIPFISINEDEPIHIKKQFQQELQEYKPHSIEIKDFITRIIL